MNGKKEESFFKTFADCQELPWSGFNWRIQDEPDSFATKFLEAFGSQVWAMDLELQTEIDGKLLGFLKRTPNLRSLKVKLSDAFPSPAVDFQVDLRLLKSLTVNVSEYADGAFDLLILLLNSATRFDSLKLVLPSLCKSENSAGKLVAEFPSGIPLTALKIFQYPIGRSDFVYNAIVGMKLKLRELDIVFDVPFSKWDQSFCAPLAAIATNCQETLRSLKLTIIAEGHFSLAKTAFLKFPLMPALTSLTLQIIIRGDDHEAPDPTNLTRSLLSAVNVNQFPFLERVLLRMDDSFEKLSSTISIFKHQQYPFPTVKELRVESWQTDDQFHVLFPNLERLTATVNDTRLIYILGNMPNLEHLKLIFEREWTRDVNSVLSGVVGAEDVYHEPVEKISLLRTIFPRPSLSSMYSKFSSAHLCMD